MSERALLERFDLVAENPENIPLLRRYIVDLAVRGKLLEKTALDISAEEMLKRIDVKADLLIKQGQFKKQKPLDPIGVEEIPAAYAAHCTFERLGNVANLQKGQTGIQSAIPGNYPLVVTAAARSTCDHYDFDGAAAIVPMVSSTGHGNASLNRLHYQEGKFALGTILCAVFSIDEELISARFLFEYLTAFKDELLVSKMNGTANVTLTVGKIAEVPVPIIAPAVQRRVYELMVMCDQLEAAKNEREAWRDRLVAASLHRIGTAPAATDETTTEAQSATHLCDAARFHLDHLPRLTTRPEHIKQLRQTILNLAVRGRLVPQDPNDEPVNLSTSPDDLKSASLPKSWRYDHLANLLVEDTRNGYSRRPDEAPDGIPILRISAGTVRCDGVVAEEEHKLISGIDPATRAQYGLKPGDLLACRFNGNKASVGRLTIFNDYLGIQPIYPDKLIRVRVAPALSVPAFLRLAGDTDLVRGNVEAACATTVGNWGISASNLKGIRFPVPPLPEQHRIVAKVDELMALCDQLEVQLTTTQIASRRLLEAVLHEALAPALEKAA